MDPNQAMNRRERKKNKNLKSKISIHIQLNRMTCIIYVELYRYTHFNCISRTDKNTEIDGLFDIQKRKFIKLDEQTNAKCQVWKFIVIWIHCTHKVLFFFFFFSFIWQPMMKTAHWIRIHTKSWSKHNQRSAIQKAFWFLWQNWSRKKKHTIQ